MVVLDVYSNLIELYLLEFYTNVVDIGDICDFGTYRQRGTALYAETGIESDVAAEVKRKDS